MKRLANVPAWLLERRYHGAHPLRLLWEFLGDDRAKLAWAALFQVIKHSPVWVMPLIVANVVDALARSEGRGRSLALNLGVLVLVILQNIPNQIVSMRLLSGASRIVAMQEGRIAEVGSHERLLAAGGLYARLHALQFGTTGAGADGRGLAPSPA